MNIVEEVVRRRQTFVINDPGDTYAEIRDLLERRMGFDEVVEEKYFNDIEEERIRSRIETVDGFDNVTKEELEIYLYIDGKSREVDIQVKGKLATHYEVGGGWKDSLWYYAYTALYEKFLYGSVREGYEHAVEEKVEELFQRLRQNIEVSAKHG